MQFLIATKFQLTQSIKWFLCNTWASWYSYWRWCSVNVICHSNIFLPAQQKILLALK